MRSWRKRRVGEDRHGVAGPTPESITRIREQVGDAIGIKAAGGTNDLGTLPDLYRRALRGFGLGWRTATSSLGDVRHLPSGAVET